MSFTSGSNNPNQSQQNTNQAQQADLNRALASSVLELQQNEEEAVPAVLPAEPTINVVAPVSVVENPSFVPSFLGANSPIPYSESTFGSFAVQGGNSPMQQNASGIVNLSGSSNLNSTALQAAPFQPSGMGGNLTIGNPLATHINTYGLGGSPTLRNALGMASPTLTLGNPLSSSIHTAIGIGGTVQLGNTISSSTPGGANYGSLGSVRLSLGNPLNAYSSPTPDFRRFSLGGDTMPLPNVNEIEDELTKYFIKSPISFLKKYFKDLNLPFLNKLLQLTNDNGEFIFNINTIIDDNSNRLIDLIEQKFSLTKNQELLEILRKHGSVEPKAPIGNPQKLIMKSNEAPDLIDGNDIKAKNILNLMEQKFSFNDEQLTKKIAEFRKKISKEMTDLRDKLKAELKEMEGTKTTEQIEEYRQKQEEFIKKSYHAEWNGYGRFSVLDVIDTLAEMTKVYDRLSVSWSFKKVLGTLIHIAQDSEDMTSNLVYTLKQLKMCDLSKLIHLLNVGQDVIIDAPAIVDYGRIDFSEYSDILQIISNKLIEAFGDKAPLALIKWYGSHSNSTNGKFSPENWCSNIQEVQAIFNKTFMDFPNVTIESYHFTDGLKSCLIDTLINEIHFNTMNSASINQKLNVIQIFQELIKIGSKQLASEYFDKIVDGAITDLTAIAPTCEFSLSFSNLKFLEYDEIKHYYDRILQKHGADQAAQFVQFLFEECLLSDEVIKKAQENHKDAIHANCLSPMRLEEMDAAMDGSF